MKPDTMHRTRQALAQPGEQTCLDWLPRVVHEALASTTGEDADFNSSLLHHAINLYTRNYTWTDPFAGNQTVDWGINATTIPSEAITGNTTREVPGLGYWYFSLPTHANATLDCGANEGWRHSLLNRTASGWHVSPLTCGSPVGLIAETRDEIVLALIRLDKEKEDTTIRLEVTP